MINDDQRKADAPMNAEAGKQFNEWLASDQGTSIHDMSVFKSNDPLEDSLFFLRNKLRRAFEAGMNKGAQAMKEKALKTVDAYFSGFS